MVCERERENSDSKYKQSLLLTSFRNQLQLHSFFYTYVLKLKLPSLKKTESLKI